MRFTSFRRSLWERHANPWSVWMLMAIYPALIGALYRRNVRQFVATLALVPLGVLPFRRPADDRAWGTRVVLGEQVWMRQIESGHVTSREVLLVAGATPIHLLTFAAALRRSLVGTIAGVAASVALMLLFFQRMVAVYEASKTSGV